MLCGYSRMEQEQISEYIRTRSALGQMGEQIELLAYLRVVGTRQRKRSPLKGQLKRGIQPAKPSESCMLWPKQALIRPVQASGLAGGVTMTD